MKYFFAQDDSCHWYMIPVEKRTRWNEVNKMDIDTDEGYEAWQEFNDYLTGGGIGDIEFSIDDKAEQQLEQMAKALERLKVNCDSVTLAVITKALADYNNYLKQGEDEKGQKG